MRSGSLAWALGFVLTAGLVAVAHDASPLPDSRIARPIQQFGLPFAGEPGPNTWLMGQAYGNTVGGYRRRLTDYRSGQGIHFGVDFSAPCGTPVRAIGDGVVSEVDGSHGSGPHNLVLEHGQGLASLYGHLSRRSSLRVGQRVKRGDLIGLSGDSQLTCVSAPHLHLEIRDASHQRFFNPVLFINADWHTLALTGGFSRGYQRDLGNPRRWQTVLDQPQARRGGGLLNNFAQPWPPAPDGPRINPPARIRAFVFQADLEASLSITPKRLTSNGCCANPFWSADSNRVVFIDRPDRNPATLYAVSAFEPGTPTPAFSGVAFLSPTERYALLPGPVSWLERVSDGKRSRIRTIYGNLTYSPSESRVAWAVSDSRGNFDRLTTQIFTAELISTASNVGLSAPRLVGTLFGGGVVAWLDETRVLVTGKSNPTERDRSLRVLDTRDGSSRVLVRALNFRAVNLAPSKLSPGNLASGGRWLAYYTAFDSAARNGMFVMDTSTGQARKLPWFGSYRWRDQNRIVYVPLEMNAASHRVLEMDASTGITRELVNLGAKIALDQWQVSPDGRRMMFVNAQDNNIYALELP
jgi:hypothetical protein